MTTRDQAIQAWQEAKRNAEYWTKEEQRLRLAAVGANFNGLVLGTNRIELGNGYYLAAKTAYNYSLQNKNGETEAALQYIETSGADGPEIASRIVKWKPTLSVSTYGTLAMEYRQAIDRVLTATPAMIALEIEAPE